MGRSSLSSLNTFGVHAQARSLWRITSAAQLPRLLAHLEDQAQGTPLVLGGGSNLLLVGDVDRPVLHICLPGIQVIRHEGRKTVVQAGAGVAWDALVHWTLHAGLAGLENLALIPGSVGAAPIQNIGAYGVEFICAMVAGGSSMQRTADSTTATASSRPPLAQTGWCARSASPCLRHRVRRCRWTTARYARNWRVPVAAHRERSTWRLP